VSGGKQGTGHDLNRWGNPIQHFGDVFSRMKIIRIEKISSEF
jgi:hypothetical protein